MKQVLLTDEYELERLAKERAEESELPCIARPVFPKVDVGDVLGIPVLMYPTDLGDLTPNQIGKEFSLWTGWALYANYLLAVASVREEASKDIYEYNLRQAMLNVENDVKKDLVKARAEERYPSLREWRKKYEQERTFRIFLGGHFGQRDNLGGLAGTFKRGADSISRYITLRAMEVDLEKREM